MKIFEIKIDFDPENKSKLTAMLDSQNPKVIILVGLPGSGKSTFINTYDLKSKYHIASTDDIIEEKAKEAGITYYEMFHKVKFSDIIDEMFDRVRDAVDEGQSIIFDQVNINAKSRKFKLRSIPRHYDRYAVVFNPGRTVVDQRLESRKKKTGKSIPKEHIDRMAKIYGAPNAAENYKDVIFINK